MDKKWSIACCVLLLSIAIIVLGYWVSLVVPLPLALLYCIVLGYVQKNPPNGWDGWGLRMICFSENTLWDFVTLTCTLKNSEESKLSPLGNSAEVCETCWKFQGQKPRPMEIPH